MKRYRIISELGKGATGVVYKALRADDGSVAALKKLVLPGHLDARQEEEFITRFKSEAEAALSMNHPGIVKALDCGLDEGTFYIAYELIEGVTLEEAMKSGRKFSPEEVADILVQAADALDFAHGLGVVHRDISPGNIFIGKDGKVKIADFGVARFLGRGTPAEGADDAIVGTPGYMSPEAVTGGAVDGRSDIFSLGSVAYELLTGKPPFKGENIAQIIHQVLHVQPEAIRQISPSVPIALEELVVRMMSKNIDYRYQSMSEVKAASERVITQIPRKARVEVEDAGRAPYLLVIDGVHKGAKYDLLPSVTTIGRTVGDVLLDRDPEIAKQHAWITREGDTWVLYDADTPNGTFVNEERITREEILPGDRIKVGGSVLEFRGAGGHSGVFGDPSQTLQPSKTQAAPASANKKNLMVLAAAAIVLVILFATSLVFLLVVIPGKYISKVDVATNDRWILAFDELGMLKAGDPAWVSAVNGILQDWQANPLPSPESFYAPGWLSGSQKVKTETDHRYYLFKTAEDFLDVVFQASQSTEGVPAGGVLSNAYGATGTLESELKSYQVPKGVSVVWSARTNQLQGVIARWRTELMAGATTETGDFIQERASAKDHLLNGYFTYREAGGNFATLEEAFNQFQSCRADLEPVLQAHKNEPESSAVTGLAGFLAAKILKEVGTPDRVDRWQRGIDILDLAIAEIAGTNEQSWGKAIPTELKNEFPTRQSVTYQMNALKTNLENMVNEYGPGQGQSNPEQASPSDGDNQNSTGT